MKSDTLLDAIGGARDEYILDVRSFAQKERRQKGTLFQRPAAMAAAFAVIVTLAIPVRAELVNGYVSNLLAPLYGNAQTEIVDQIGKPINASVAVGEYTLTADAVIGDRYNMAIVYSLTRMDGGELKKGFGFEDYHNTAKKGTWGGAHRFHLSADKTVLYIVEEWTSANRLWLGRKATAAFTNLMFYDEDTQEKVLIEEGTWELKFTVRYEDSSVRIPAADAVVKDESGKEYTIHNILISSIGIHMDMTAPNRVKFYPAEETPYRDFAVSLLLNDGTEINLEGNIASRGNLEDDRHKADFGTMFDEPIPLEKIKELVICGTVFQLADQRRTGFSGG